jgi:hypothetical protein
MCQHNCPMVRCCTRLTDDRFFCPSLHHQTSGGAWVDIEHAMAQRSTSASSAHSHVSAHSSSLLELAHRYTKQPSSHAPRHTQRPKKPKTKAKGRVKAKARGWMPAVVPGTVLTTLIANGVYDDPYTPGMLVSVSGECGC